MRDNPRSLGEITAEIVSGLRVPPGVEVLPVTDRQTWLGYRESDVTASVASALFGDRANPYMTPFRLWALKSGLIAEDETEEPAMRRGRLLEPVAIDLLREERPTWKIERALHYFSNRGLKVGATPDAFATRPDIAGVGIVQVKTVDGYAFKRDWLTPEGALDVPLWIIVQAAVEAALTGATWAVVAAMVWERGGLSLYVEEIPIKPALIRRVYELAADFWRRVLKNDPYPVDYGKDAETIFRIYREDDGGIVDLSGNARVLEILAERETLEAREKAGREAAKVRRSRDAELIHLLGNAGRGQLSDGRVIEAPTRRRKGHYVPDSIGRSVSIKHIETRRARSDAEPSFPAAF